MPPDPRSRADRLVLTGWEATNLADERLPQWARRIDLMRDLTEAGFEQVDVAGKPAWREAERDLYESSIQADAAGDPAIESLQEQARRGLELFDSSRRVCATRHCAGLIHGSSGEPGSSVDGIAGPARASISRRKFVLNTWPVSPGSRRRS